MHRHARVRHRRHVGVGNLPVDAGHHLARERPDMEVDRHQADDEAQRRRVRLGAVLEGQLAELRSISPDDLISGRYKKFRAMGAFGE